MSYIKQNVFTKTEYLYHVKQCTAHPNAHLKGADRYKYGKPPPSFCVMQQTSRGIEFPRFYAQEHLKDKITTQFTSGIPIELEFNGSLREHQIKSVDCILKAYNKTTNGGGGLLCLGCGLGKTVIACHMISIMKTKTAVVVHKTFLVNQWKERMLQFLPGVKIGIVQGKVIDIENKDVVIFMLQSLSQKVYNSELFQEFGQLIVDECHHIAANVFSKGMFKFCSKYTLGLSATPDRKDGLENVIHWFIGPTVLTLTSCSDENRVEVQKYTLDIEYPEEIYNKMGKLNMASMITQIGELEERNSIIIQIIFKLLERKDGHLRKLLVLSERRGQLKILEGMLLKEGCPCGLYVGGMSQEALKKSEKLRVILSTYPMTAEGFDVPELNTLIFATPKTDIEQSCGRILRKLHSVPAIIVDIIDNYSLFKVQSYQRHYFYKNRNYNESVHTLDNSGPVQVHSIEESNTKETKIEAYAFLDSDEDEDENKNE